MESAAAAMEKVPLMTSADENASTEVTVGDSVADEIMADSEYDASITDGPPGFLDRLLYRVHRVFSRFCNALGAFFLRALSTIMLLAGIIGSVILQLLAFYYTGVLNVWVLMACIFYMPSLVSVAIIREEMLLHGTGKTGAGPRLSKFVTFAYLLMALAAFASFTQPMALHGENKISVRSMWTSIAATGFFYYSLLISEVLFATALNVRRAKEADDELRRRDLEDPHWMSNYQAITGSRQDESEA